MPKRKARDELDKNARSSHPENVTSRKSSRPKKEVNYSEENIIESNIGSSSSSLDKISGPQIEIYKTNAGLPVRNASTGDLVFRDHPEFTPNLTPKEVLQLGSFGGTYFRPIHSRVTGQNYGSEVWKELPEDWLEGLDIKTQVASSVYQNRINRYNIDCGGVLFKIYKTFQKLLITLTTL